MFMQDHIRRDEMGSDNRIEVLLVDDHQYAREGLRRMLELDGSINVVGEAVNVDEAVAQMERLSPDIILMDIKMPDKDGIEGARLLKEKQPDCKIIMLTLYEEYIAEAMEAGAVGYILKDAKREELVRAVRAAQEGKVPLSALSKEFFTKFVTSANDPNRPSLTERELEILRLIADGATTREIGAQLFLSEATIKRDVQRVFDKLDVRNRSEAVAEACKRKLV